MTTTLAGGKQGSGTLMLTIRSAYWVALLLFAGIVTASYLMLNSIMASHHRDDLISTIANTQKTLSQRIVFLVNATEKADVDLTAELLLTLKHETNRFEDNYDLLIAETGLDPLSPARQVQGTIENIFFSAPHHLDHFSMELVANSRRFIAAAEKEAGLRHSAIGYSADYERTRLDATVANSALKGYQAMDDNISREAEARLMTMQTMHRMLYLATMGMIIAIALLIFRPMANLIDRRTRDLVAARNEMAHNASHDALTGLYNRAFFNENFAGLVERTGKAGDRLAVIQLDLDRFKQINDTLGHATGDRVLVETARRMLQVCGEHDFCIRLGGDEFVVVLTQPGENGDVARIAARLLDRINQPIAAGSNIIATDASAGIAVFPDDAGTPSDLLMHADLALYSAKRGGGGAFSFFTEALRSDLDKKKSVEHEVRLAVERREFVVFFQPQVSLSDGSITGVEALMRWMHPSRGAISPGEFLPVAERVGLMPAIGRIVMRKAIAEAARWHRDGISFGRLALNVSGNELREPDFAAFLFETLKGEGLPASRLSLEIVESVILDDDNSGIAAKLRQIRAAGVQLELDDFGTGYASLSHVNPDEIDRLKIDRRFVQNIDMNGGNSKIVRAITDLARSLGISIVAEGAETQAELDLLSAIGCDNVQGYSIAFPMPGSQMREWMERRTGGRPRLVETGKRIA